MQRSEVAGYLDELRSISEKAATIVPDVITSNTSVADYEFFALNALLERAQEICNLIQREVPRSV
jgi:hypothetical protein